MKYFLIIFSIAALSCGRAAYPRYNEEINFHKRLEKFGYVQVTSCNLVNGKQQIIIKKQ